MRRAGTTPRPAALLVAAAISALGPVAAPSASAADPVQLGTVTGACKSEPGSNNVFYGAPVTSDHPGVMVRYSVQSGRASLNTHSVATGEALWNPTSSLPANSSPRVDALCSGEDSEVPFTATFHDTPTTPTSFSGAGGRGEGSTMWFNVPADAQYVADIELSGGAIKVTSPARYGSQDLASSGQFVFGTLVKGSQYLKLMAHPGPVPTWKVSIRALPVAISELKFGKSVIRPGDFVQASYVASGDTAITAVVRNAAGQVVKTLASGLAVERGAQSLSWDGRDEAGGALPSGTYTLQLDSKDPSGQSSSASTSIVIDASPTCSNGAAQAAVLNSKSLVKAIKKTRVLYSGAGIFDVYRVYKLVCKDFTGDGVKDMGVLMLCCTAASPTPVAVFRAVGPSWKLAYSSTRRLVWNLSARGSSLIMRSPVYRRGNAACCPSKYAYYKLAWKGKSFKLGRTKP